MERVRKWALARPGALIVDAPGNAPLRWLVEAAIDRRGWHPALSPADASVMLTVGELSPALADAADILWSQMPQPRHRLAIDGTSLNAQLDAALDKLSAPAAHTDNHTDPATQLGTAHGPDAHRDHAMHDDGGHDMGGHMHHGGDVAGLAMAGTAPDRDGLELDQLKVSLGPVLPGWPTGLILTGSMQGDILTDVDLAWADRHHGHGHAGDPVIAAVDVLTRFLVVAGWPSMARRAREARTELMSGNPAEVERGHKKAAAVGRSISRSRSLAWSLRGVGAARPGRLPGHAGGDVLDRVRTLAAVAAGDSPVFAAVTPGDVIPLLEGAELAAVRLIVASLVLGPSPVVASPGIRHD